MKPRQPIKTTAKRIGDSHKGIGTSSLKGVDVKPYGGYTPLSHKMDVGAHIEQNYSVNVQNQLKLLKKISNVSTLNSSHMNDQLSQLDNELKQWEEKMKSKVKKNDKEQGSIIHISASNRLTPILSPAFQLSTIRSNAKDTYRIFDESYWMKQLSSYNQSHTKEHEQSTMTSTVLSNTLTVITEALTQSISDYKHSEAYLSLMSLLDSNHDLDKRKELISNTTLSSIESEIEKASESLLEKLSEKTNQKLSASISEKLKISVSEELKTSASQELMAKLSTEFKTNVSEELVASISEEMRRSASKGLVANFSKELKTSATKELVTSTSEEVRTNVSEELTASATKNVMTKVSDDLKTSVSKERVEYASEEVLANVLDVIKELKRESESRIESTLKETEKKKSKEDLKNLQNHKSRYEVRTQFVKSMEQEKERLEAKILEKLQVKLHETLFTPIERTVTQRIEGLNKEILLAKLHCLIEDVLIKKSDVFFHNASEKYLSDVNDFDQLNWTKILVAMTPAGLIDRLKESVETLYNNRAELERKRDDFETNTVEVFIAHFENAYAEKINSSVKDSMRNLSFNEFLSKEVIRIKALEWHELEHRESTQLLEEWMSEILMVNEALKQHVLRETNHTVEKRLHDYSRTHKVYSVEKYQEVPEPWRQLHDSIANHYLNSAKQLLSVQYQSAFHQLMYQDNKNDSNFLTSSSYENPRNPLLQKLSSLSNELEHSVGRFDRSIRIQLEGLKGLSHLIDQSKLNKLMNVHIKTSSLTNLNSNSLEANKIVTNKIVTNEKVTNEIVTNEKVTNEKVTNEKVTNEKVTNEMLTNRMLTNRMLTNKEVSKEEIGDEILKNEIVRNEVIRNEVIRNEVIRNEVIRNEVIRNKEVTKEMLTKEIDKSRGTLESLIQNDRHNSTLRLMHKHKDSHETFETSQNKDTDSKLNEQDYKATHNMFKNSSNLISNVLIRHYQILLNTIKGQEIGGIWISNNHMLNQIKQGNRNYNRSQTDLNNELTYSNLSLAYQDTLLEELRRIKNTFVNKNNVQSKGKNSQMLQHRSEETLEIAVQKLYQKLEGSLNENKVVKVLNQRSIENITSAVIKSTNPKLLLDSLVSHIRNKQEITLSGNTIYNLSHKFESGLINKLESSLNSNMKSNLNNKLALVNSNNKAVYLYNTLLNDEMVLLGDGLLGVNSLIEGPTRALLNGLSQKHYKTHRLNKSIQWSNQVITRLRDVYDKHMNDLFSTNEIAYNRSFVPSRLSGDIYQQEFGSTYINQETHKSQVYQDNRQVNQLTQSTLDSYANTVMDYKLEAHQEDSEKLSKQVLSQEEMITLIKEELALLREEKQVEEVNIDRLSEVVLREITHKIRKDRQRKGWI